jgi:hypothetical protein
VSFHACHERRALQARILPELRAVVRRHEPVLQEWSVDLGAGRDVVDLLAPLAELPPVRLPAGPPIPCQWCWGQRRLWESGVLGLVPLICERCSGSGWDPS